MLTGKRTGEESASLVPSSPDRVWKKGRKVKAFCLFYVSLKGNGVVLPESLTAFP